MNADQLRAAIATDCPHRLVDYDRHVANAEARGWQITAAFIELWRREHAVSSRPDVEQQLDQLYRQAQDTDDYTTAKGYLEQASRIRHQIAEGLK